MNSLLLHELAYVPNWTKHHLTQAEPMDGVESSPGEVFRIFEGSRDKIEEVLQNVSRDVYVIKMKSGVWYETPVKNLEEHRQRMLAATTGDYRK